ncbi:MAG: hypothetical protein KKD65_12775 [Gammaproteobacteria bacterium]|nr:hypothetical protein [Gammaproteobacteria bacterium]
MRSESKKMLIVAIIACFSLLPSLSQSAETLPEFGLKGITLGASLSGLERADPLLASCQAELNHQACRIDFNLGKYETFAGEKVISLQLYAADDKILEVIVQLSAQSNGLAAFEGRVKKALTAKYGAPSAEMFKNTIWKSANNTSMRLYIGDNHASIIMRSSDYDAIFKRETELAKQQKETNQKTAKEQRILKGIQDAEIRHKGFKQRIAKELE